MSSLREQFDVEADAIPALGDIDAALAHVARERRTWRRVGLAALAAAAAVVLLVLGVRPLLSNHDPAVGPTTTVSPTPTASSPPVVRRRPEGLRVAIRCRSCCLAPAANFPSGEPGAGEGAADHRGHHRRYRDADLHRVSHRAAVSNRDRHCQLLLVAAA